MVRLTKCENGRKSFNCDGCERLGGDCDPGDCNKEAVKRLEALENALGPDYNLNILRELMEADRDERVVVLPCKVGDTLWVIFYEQVVPVKVRTFFFGQKGVEMIRTTKWDVPFSDYGKTIFATQGEAEAALRKRQWQN